MTPTDAEGERVEKLVASRREAAAELHAVAQRAITGLVARGRSINFRAVADEAGCSAGYLYKHDDLADRIREIRDGQPKPRRGRPATEPSSDRSLHTKLEAASRRNRELESVVARLRSENSNLLAKILEGGI